MAIIIVIRCPLLCLRVTIIHRLDGKLGSIRPSFDFDGIMTLSPFGKGNIKQIIREPY